MSAKAFASGLLMVAFVFLAINVQKGESIKCWVCSSDIDHRCGDPFNKTSHRYLISDCDRDRSQTSYLRTQAVCRKFKHSTGGGESVIVRSCTWASDREDEHPCSSSSLPPMSKIEYCSTCDTDECNSAMTAAVLPTLIFLPLALMAPRFF